MRPYSSLVGMESTYLMSQVLMLGHPAMGLITTLRGAHCHWQPANHWSWRCWQLGALYVGTLSLGGGLSQLAEISANDVNVYYVASLNPWLNDGSYALSGGGELLPIQGFGDQAALLQGANLVSLPEPTSLGLLSFAALPMLRRRLRLKRSVYIVQIQHALP